MSFSGFEQACEAMVRVPGFETSGGIDEQSIQEAEAALGLKFSRQCRRFYNTYDYTTIDGYELFGIHGGAHAAILEGNCVAYALNDRQQYKLPHEWVPLLNFLDGTMAYIDYSKINDQNEPQVIRAFYAEDQYCVVEVLAEDLGGFLTRIVDSL